MLYKPCIYLWILMFPFTISVAENKPELIVATDSKGDFTSIQEAIDAAPNNASEPYIILIKNGKYNEKLFIDKPFITLVGEDRDSTRIILPISRDEWLADHPGDDWGAAIINIGNYANDFTLANMTVYNNYGSLNNGTGHQFAIRGFGATRIILINCNIKADGGDTVSLWNSNTGLYYHAYCFFEGGVDFVCPRGWCYITNSEFFGHNYSAAIWHDGRKNEDQKFVIRNSFFDGVMNFPLGRNHVDAQFYLLDCTFSENMANWPIYQVNDPLTYLWGERYYYYNSHREGGDYAWHSDNLWEAKGAPTPEEITPFWTLRHQWDPESNMPAVLPFAFLPKPEDGKLKVDLNSQLTWTPGLNAVSYNIYFDVNNPPKLASKVTEPVYSPGTLNPDVTYYWQVDVVTDEDTINGSVWSFKTETELSPQKASNPSPPDKAVDVPVPVEKLLWDMDVTIADTAKIYFGTSPDSLLLLRAYTIGGWDPGPLQLGQTYYWRVDLSNKNGMAEGDLWQFTMEKPQFKNADFMQMNDHNGIVSIEVENFTDSTNIGQHTWELVTNPVDYSGIGAMQVLPDNGYFAYTGYLTKCSRLDFAVDFIKTGKHYIWIRAYSNNSQDNVFHAGLNLVEEKTVSRIGNFDNIGQWEWIHRAASVSGEPRTFEVKALGVQRVSLWYGKDGAIADKIVLTTNPNYVPTGYGPDETVGLENKTKLLEPKQYHLYQNYPNPFNPKTTIRYNLAVTSEVQLDVFNILGQKITSIVSAKQPAGMYTVEWDASKVSSGLYYYRLNTDHFQRVRKMILLR